MKLTVLGKYGPYQKAGGACSSYLLEYGDAKVLLDAGNGSFANLQKTADYRFLDAIILSHLHSDHMSDLLVMRYAIQIKKCPPRPLVLPATPTDMYKLLAGEKAYAADICTDGKAMQIKGATVTFKKMTHPAESYAVKIAVQNKMFVYSGDTNMNDDLAGFARGANLLVCDAQFNNQNLFPGAPHLSAAQAAQIAAKAGVQKLLLSHINPDQDEAELLRQAKEHFADCEIAQEMREYGI